MVRVELAGPYSSTSSVLDMAPVPWNLERRITFGVGCLGRRAQSVQQYARGYLPHFLVILAGGLTTLALLGWTMMRDGIREAIRRVIASPLGPSCDLRC